MTNLSLFLEADQERADQEIDQYGYLHKNAIEFMAQGEFGKAAAYHENVARTLHDLQALKNSKALYDGAKSLLKQIEARDQEELLGRLSK